MSRFVQYYGSWRQVQGNLFGLPSWARTVVAIFAIPGVILIGLSIVALGVSILALLLLTVPVYRLMRFLVGTQPPSPPFDAGRPDMIEGTIVPDDSNQ